MLAYDTCFSSQEGYTSCLFLSLSGDFGSSVLALSPLLAPFWSNAGVFSSHLMYIVSTLRMVRTFFSMGGTRVPFLD